MNNARRKRLQIVLDRLNDLHEEMEAIMEEEQEAYDNMPESLQESERGEQSYNAISKMEEIIYSIEEAEEAFDEAME